MRSTKKMSTLIDTVNNNALLPFKSKYLLEISFPVMIAIKM